MTVATNTFDTAFDNDALTALLTELDEDDLPQLAPDPDQDAGGHLPDFGDGTIDRDLLLSDEFKFDDHVPNDAQIYGDALPHDVEFDAALAAATVQPAPEPDKDEGGYLPDFGDGIVDRGVLLSDELRFDDHVPNDAQIYGDNDNSGENDDNVQPALEPDQDAGGYLPDFGDGVVDRGVLLSDEFKFDDHVPNDAQIYGGPPHDVPHDVKFDVALVGAAIAPPASESADQAATDAEQLAEAALQSFAARAEAETPMEHVSPRVDMVTRDWQVTFGPVWGPAGGVTTISVSPQCYFRGEKVVATDTSSTPGQGTRILAVAVSQRIQQTGANGQGVLTSFFAANALANGIKFDTAQQWSKIALTVQFIQSCTFDCTVFGRAQVTQ